MFLFESQFLISMTHVLLPSLQLENQKQQQRAADTILTERAALYNLSKNVFTTVKQSGRCGSVLLPEKLYSPKL